MENGELRVPQLNGSRHGDAALFGDLPAAGAWDLGDESMRVAAAKNA